MMRELGRDATSGLMAQKLKKMDSQDKLFPAEDAITVENLLTVSSSGMDEQQSRFLNFNVEIINPDMF